MLYWWTRRERKRRCNSVIERERKREERKKEKKKLDRCFLIPSSHLRLLIASINLLYTFFFISDVMF